MALEYQKSSYEEYIDVFLAKKITPFRVGFNFFLYKATHLGTYWDWADLYIGTYISQQSYTLRSA